MRHDLLLPCLLTLLALPAAAQTLPDAATPTTAAAKPVVQAKWATTLYGFAEYDAIVDSTQGLNEGAGHGLIPRNGTYAGNHARLSNAMRNSRLGLKLAGPDGGIKTSGVFEMDFLGNQPAGSEANLLTTPLLRVRHLNLKWETGVVDVTLGQTWQLFGAQPLFHPNTVEIQGVPGQVYARSPQLRLAHTLKTDAVNVELAVAAARPAQRDNGGLPDAQAKLLFSLNHVRGVHTGGSTGTAEDALSVAVSGVARHLELPEFAVSPKNSAATLAWGVSVDVLLPIVPATLANRGNALTLTGSLVTGAGINDLFSGLTGGASHAAIPVLDPKTNTTVPTPYTGGTLDSGLAVFTADGKLTAVKWQAAVVGLQYYLPPAGHIWMSVNYADIKSDNIAELRGTAATKAVFSHETWADANLFWDVTSAVRLGGEVARFQQDYLDNSQATNWRGQFSAFYLF